MLTGFELCRAAIAVDDITATEQSVLLVLAIMADKDDATCFPPVTGPTGLTAKTKLSERAVQRAIQRLVHLGHISRRQLRNGCIYTVHPATQAPRPATVAPKLPVTTNSPSKATPSSERERVPAAMRMLIGSIVLDVLVAACTPPARKPAPAKRRWPSAMPPPAGVSDEQWAGYVSHRNGLRKPLTDRAYELLVGKLTADANDIWPPGRIVDEMVERGWTSFKMEWLTKADNRNGKRPHQHDRPSGWAPRPGNEGSEPAYLDD
jgi:hypothetical protein